MTKTITSYLAAKKGSTDSSISKNLKLSPDNIARKSRRIELWSDEEEEIILKEDIEKENILNKEEIQCIGDSSSDIDKAENISKDNEPKNKLPIKNPDLEKTVEELSKEVSSSTKTKGEKIQILQSLGDIKIPAYQKYKTLITPTKLQLSGHFIFLNDIFAALDSTCQFASSRNQACIFHKIQKVLENIVVHSVNESHVEKVHKVYREAYDMKKIKAMHLGKLSESLLIEMKRAEDQIVLKNGVESVAFGQEELLKRKINFYNRLISIMKLHHQVY